MGELFGVVKSKVESAGVKRYTLRISHRVTQEAASVGTSVQIHYSTLERNATPHFRSFLLRRCLFLFISLPCSVLSTKVIPNRRLLSEYDTLFLFFP